MSCKVWMSFQTPELERRHFYLPVHDDGVLLPHRKKWCTRKRSPSSPSRSRRSVSRLFWCCRSGTMTASEPTTSWVRLQLFSITSPVCVPSNSRISLNVVFGWSGSIELNLSDMVRGAKQSSKCTIELAKDWASPRFSIFRAKKMKGWWPLTRLKTAEDFEREEKERQKAKKKGKKRGRRRRDKWSHMKQEDIEYTDHIGNTFLLMVANTRTAADWFSTRLSISMINES